MEGITPEQILRDLQNAIEAHPHERQPTVIENKLLTRLRIANEHDLGGLTSRQLAAATNQSVDWVGRVLMRLAGMGVARYEKSGKMYLWYIVCKEDDAG